MKTQPQPNPTTTILYNCPDGTVKVIRKITGLKRFPRHSYPCVLFVMKPQKGHRVSVTSSGEIEFMPNYAEIRALLVGIRPDLAAVIPADLWVKPRARQIYWRRRNGPDGSNGKSK